jgi:16S rRNA processing protein RimM
MALDYLIVGTITSPHGVKGEVKVYPQTDDVTRFKKCKELYLNTGKEYKLLHVVSVKYSGQFVILKFEEFNSMNEVEGLRKKELLVDRAHAVKLKKDEYFIADLIGLNVYAGERFVGKIKDVIETGANDVYVIEKEDGKELLLPAIKDCILNVDMENERMEVYILPGLEDE